MLGQKFPCTADSMQNSLGELPLSKIARHLVRDFLPKFIPALRVNGAVANDCKFSNARRDEKQNSVSLRRFLHSQMMKNFLRGGDRIFRFFAADEDLNLAPHFQFGLGDCFDNRVMLKLA